jgi:hypothetical protein
MTDPMLEQVEALNPVALHPGDTVMLRPKLKGMPAVWLIIMRDQLAEATQRTGVHFVLLDESLDVVRTDGT